MKVFGPPSSSLRSPDFSAIRGARLTDKRIDYYAKRGFYGETARTAHNQPKTKRRKREKKFDAMAAAMELLK